MKGKIVAGLLLLFNIGLGATELTDSIDYRWELEEVTISANRQTDVKLKVPQQVFVLPQKQIERANVKTTADLLTENGMLTVQKSQQGGGSPMIRGFESSRVLLVMDNVRMNNLIYRAGHLQNVITVDQAMLERAEVLYGPSSVIYGSDALGGVVTFKTKEPLLSDNGKVIFGGNAFMRYGTSNNETTGHVDFNIGDGRFASLTSLSYSNFGDLRGGRNKNPFLKNDEYIHRLYEVVRENGEDLLIGNKKRYHQPGSGYMQYDLLQKFLFKPNERFRHSLNFQFSNTDDIPRYDRLTDMKKDKPKFAEWYYGPQFRLMTAYAMETTDWLSADRAGFTLAYQKVKESRHNRKFNEVWLGSRNESVDVLSFSSDWIKSVDNHHFHTGVDGALNFLLSTAYKTNVDTGERGSLDTRYPDGKNYMHTIDAYISHRWEIMPTLTFNDGIRIGYSTLYSGFENDEFFPFLSRDVKEVKQNNVTYSFSVGLNYNPTDNWKLALSLSTGYRVPNVDDVGKVFDSQPGMVVVPNPNVKPEKTINVDLNISHVRNDRLLWETVMFGTYLFDAITLKPFLLNGAGEVEYDGEMSDVFANHNSRRAYVLGASTRLIVKFPRNFVADAALTYTYGDIVGGENERLPLDHISPVFGRTGVSYNSSNERAFVEFYALFNGKKKLNRYNLNGEDNIDYATLKGADGEGLPAWFTLNLKTSYRFNPHLTVQVGIENLLDTEYRTFGSGINASGRNISFTLRTAF